MPLQRTCPTSLQVGDGLYIREMIDFHPKPWPGWMGHLASMSVESVEVKREEEEGD